MKSSDGAVTRFARPGSSLTSKPSHPRKHLEAGQTTPRPRWVPSSDGGPPWQCGRLPASVARNSWADKQIGASAQSATGAAEVAGWQRAKQLEAGITRRQVVILAGGRAGFLPTRE